MFRIIADIRKTLRSCALKVREVGLGTERLLLQSPGPAGKMWVGLVKHFALISLPHD